MLHFSGWPRKLGSPFNWDSQKWSKMRHIVKFRPRRTPYGKSGHGTPWYYGRLISGWKRPDSEASRCGNMKFCRKKWLRCEIEVKMCITTKKKIPDGIEKHVHLPSLWVIWERSLIPLSPHMRQQLAALDSVISFAFLQQASKSAPLTRRLFCTLPLATEKDVRHLSHLILLTNPATYSTWVQLL